VGIRTELEVTLVDSRLETMSERMSAAARELQDQHDAASTVTSAVDLLVRNVEGCDAASISLVYAKRRVETPAASNDLAATADRLQAELGEGPALNTLWDEETVHVTDLATDIRWPKWGPRLTQTTGVRSVLTFRLFTLKDVIGALSMYSMTADAFSAEDKAEGLALAAHIAIAVLAAQRLDQYETALDSRTVIAQACGVVMERFNIDATHAFAVLTRLSSTQNIKLREVATELLRTRIIPTQSRRPDEPVQVSVSRSELGAPASPG
jgi:transcriptional regulator with GAF, ATPase, and Fis domain